MALGKSGLMLSFAFVGFLLGSVAYLLLDWIIVNGINLVLYIPIPVFAPWFAAGLAGSAISIIMLYAVSKITRDN